jgi:hypothetical protein
MQCPANLIGPSYWDSFLAYVDTPFMLVQNVRVLLLVWDDRTSRSVEFVKITGVMDTHDEDTKHFFRGSKVQCKLAPR